MSAAPGARFTLHGTRGSYVKHGLDPQEDALKAGRRPQPRAAWGEDRPGDGEEGDTGGQESDGSGQEGGEETALTLTGAGPAQAELIKALAGLWGLAVKEGE